MPRAAGPFDSSLATVSTRIVPLRVVIDLLASAPHNAERIAEYRHAMLNGARFPPIAVVRIGSKYLVADGHKRLSAFRTLGEQELCVQVWRWRDWWADQARQARDHGKKHVRILRLSRTDPRAALRLWFSTVQHWMRVARALTGSSSGRP